LILGLFCPLASFSQATFELFFLNSPLCTTRFICHALRLFWVFPFLSSWMLSSSEAFSSALPYRLSSFPKLFFFSSILGGPSFFSGCPTFATPFLSLRTFYLGRFLIFPLTWPSRLGGLLDFVRKAPPSRSHFFFFQGFRLSRASCLFSACPGNFLANLERFFFSLLSSLSPSAEPPLSSLFASLSSPFLTIIYFPLFLVCPSSRLQSLFFVNLQKLLGDWFFNLHRTVSSYPIVFVPSTFFFPPLVFFSSFP